ncbi:MAG: cbb3-type cytochrome oxidase subunit 3 [Leptothrix sp. (in: b-proteobacteria)]
MEIFLDINTWRSMTTVLSFAVFLGIIAWSFSRKNRQDFDEAAALPFQEEVVTQSNTGGTHE